MKKHFSAVIAGLLLVASLAAGATNELAGGSSRKTVAASDASLARSTPGVEAAQAISTLTGVAISPLLGVGGIGAWKWWKAPAALSHWLRTKNVSPSQNCAFDASSSPG